MATRRGLEPRTSAVTGRHSNQLNYRAILELMMRLELMTSSLPRMCATTCATSASQNDLYLLSCLRFWRRHPESNWGIKVLQTSALPLGYGAVNRFIAVSGWSGLRGSNPLPPPWQGGALPNELNPLELMMRLELMTSSLPRMCATTCATSAYQKGIYIRL